MIGSPIADQRLRIALRFNKVVPYQHIIAQHFRELQRKDDLERYMKLFFATFNRRTWQGISAPTENDIMNYNEMRIIPQDKLYNWLLGECRTIDGVIYLYQQAPVKQTIDYFALFSLY